MTVITAPSVQAGPLKTDPPAVSETDQEPVNLYKLGMLFVVKCSYWSCRAGNEPDELDLTPDRITASLGWGEGNGAGQRCRRRVRADGPMRPAPV